MWLNALAQIEINGLVGWVVLSLPLFVLATMIGLAVVRWRRSSRGEITGWREDDADVSEAKAGHDFGRSGDQAGDVLSLMDGVTPHVQTESELSERNSAVLSAAGSVAVGTAMEKSTTAAEAVNALGELVLTAAKNGDADVEAAARLQLGDICEQSSDMTTACEHWQIARDLFDKGENIEAREVAEEKMRRNGCPSDWVLNDF